MATRNAELPSFNAQVKALLPGSTVSRSERVAVGTKEAKNINKVLFKLRNTCNQAVSKIRTETGSNFRVESLAGLTDDKEAIIATVAVTRLEENDADDI
jgi:hypothetical protein